MNDWARSITLGGMTGIRSMAGLKALEVPGSRWLAAGEAIADKLPFMPARTDLLPLLSRAVLGAYAGSRAAGRGKPRAGFAVAGALAAIGASFLACELRRRAARRGWAAGTLTAFAEDGVVRLAERAVSGDSSRASRVA